MDLWPLRKFLADDASHGMPAHSDETPLASDVFHFFSGFLDDSGIAFAPRCADDSPAISWDE
jgi:hypothetical protein